MRPVPRTTEASGSSAIDTGNPVSSRMRLSRFLSRAPPPVSTMPRSLMSALNSGGVRSRATRMALMMVATHSPRASRISLSLMEIVRGTPSIKLRPLMSMVSGLRPDNPPSNPELLASLVQEFVAARYDLKSIYRLILNSQTYQLSSIPRTERAEGAANFAYYPLRRLDAEVLADAICETTGTTESYTSAIPEPFTFIPEDQHAISLPDGSITSAFL